MKWPKDTVSPINRVKELHVLNIRFQFLETHRSPSIRLASSIAPENPHPYAGHTFLLASYFQSVISENVVFPCGRQYNREGRMQRSPVVGSQMDAFNVVVPRT